MRSVRLIRPVPTPPPDPCFGAPPTPPLTWTAPPRPQPAPRAQGGQDGGLLDGGTLFDGHPVEMLVVISHTFTRGGRPAGRSPGSGIPRDEMQHARPLNPKESAARAAGGRQGHVS